MPGSKTKPGMDKYLAFISYKHQARDQKISGLLRRGLESYAIPRGTRISKNRKVFRDTDELPTSSDLGKDIEDALAGSGWLITLCSEEYAKSRWCLREIDEFIALGRKDRILPVLTVGNPETAIPEAIRDVPIAADLRKVKDQALAGEMKKLIPSLLSRMSGSSEYEIAAAQRNRRIAAWAGALAALAAAAVGFAFYAVHTADVIEGKNTEIAEATRLAEREKTEAIVQRNDALKKRSAYYSGEAEKALLDGNEREAAKLALEAMPGEDDEETDAARAVNVLRQVLNIPAKPKEGYTLTYKTNCDFLIGGVMEHLEDGVRLYDRENPEIAHMVSFATGEITEEENVAQRMAKENGYRIGHSIVNDYQNMILYGSDRQMHEDIGGHTQRDFTLKGEPFYADHLWQTASGNYLLAWLEEPEGEQEMHTALFRIYGVGQTSYKRNPSEALAEIRVKGPVLSADMLSSRLAVVDGGGILRVFDIYSGECRTQAEGSWSFVHYAYNSEGLFAVTADGRGMQLDPVTLEVVYKLESPASIKQIWYCHRRKQLLCCCDDGFRIYDVTDGSLVTEVGTEDEPLGVYWGGYDGWVFSHTGNTVMVLYDQRVEIYTVGVIRDEKVSDAITLYEPGLQEGCRTILISPDSRYVYTEAGRGSIYKWDAENGELIWKNENVWSTQPSIYCSAFLSRDGKTVWRGNDAMDGYVSIDAETGETLRELEVSHGSDLETPEESAGGLMLAKKQYNGGFYVFDPSGGETLWNKDGKGDVSFSPDGGIVEFVEHITDRKTWEESYVWKRFDAKTGNVLEENTLLCFEAETYWSNLDVSPENRVILIRAYHHDVPENEIIWGVDMETGIIREYRLEHDLLSTWFPYTGGSAAGWQEENLFRISRICRLNPDGTVGKAEDPDSEAGRRLSTAKDEYLVLDDEEYKKTSGTGFAITRLTDGEPLFKAIRSTSVSGYLSPDGSFVCVYGRDIAPTIIRLSEDVQLKEKALKWLEGENDE